MVPGSFFYCFFLIVDPFFPLVLIALFVFSLFGHSCRFFFLTIRYPTVFSPSPSVVPQFPFDACSLDFVFFSFFFLGLFPDMSQLRQPLYDPFFRFYGQPFFQVYAFSFSHISLLPMMLFSFQLCEAFQTVFTSPLSTFVRAPTKVASFFPSFGIFISRTPCRGLFFQRPLLFAPS